MTKVRRIHAHNYVRIISDKTEGQIPLRTLRDLNWENKTIYDLKRSIPSNGIHSETHIGQSNKAKRNDR